MSGEKKRRCFLQDLGPGAILLARRSSEDTQGATTRLTRLLLSNIIKASPTVVVWSSHCPPLSLNSNSSDGDGTSHHFTAPTTSTIDSELMQRLAPETRDKVWKRMKDDLTSLDVVANVLDKYHVSFFMDLGDGEEDIPR